MKNDILRNKTAALLIVFAAMVVAILAMPSRPVTAPSDVGTAPVVSQDCDAAALSGPVPEGFIERIDERSCIRYAHPEPLGTPLSATPTSLHVLDPNDASTYVAIMIDDAVAEGGCHVTAAEYGFSCMTLDDVKEGYEKVTDARTEAYVAEPVRTRCDVGIDCVVVEAHGVTRSGRWLSLSAYVAAERYDGGMDEELLDIIRSMDAQ